VVMVGKALLQMMSIRGRLSHGWVGEFWICERRWVARIKKMDSKGGILNCLLGKVQNY